MKIKTKKEMNLPQLIEWGWNNKELSKNKRFISKNKGNLAIKQSVIFNHFSYAEIENNYCYGPEDTFTVEVEEPVTEDTVIPKLIVEYSYCSDVDLYKCFKVGDFMNDNAKSIYILNDDLTTTLIWTKEKGLVE